MENNGPITIGILIIAALYYGFYSRGKEIDKLQENLDSCMASNQELSDIVYEANDRLQEAENAIDDAKGYAWETYDDMGDALDELPDDISPVD